MTEAVPGSTGEPEVTGEPPAVVEPLAGAEPKLEVVADAPADSPADSELDADGVADAAVDAAAVAAAAVADALADSHADADVDAAAVAAGSDESADAAEYAEPVESVESVESAERTEPPETPEAGAGAARPDVPDVSDVADDGTGGLSAVVAERDAYLADLQRVTAEFSNFRRQTVKRNTELVAQAAARLAKEMLVVLDACEAAVSQGVDGIEPVQSQLLGVLAAEGLTVLGRVDEVFDPGFHEAVMTEPATDDAQVPFVAEVLRTGYAWNGRVLRPAMVKVRG